LEVCYFGTPPTPPAAPETWEWSGTRTTSTAQVVSIGNCSSNDARSLFLPSASDSPSGPSLASRKCTTACPRFSEEKRVCLSPGLLETSSSTKLKVALHLEADHEDLVVGWGIRIFRLVGCERRSGSRSTKKDEVAFGISPN